MKAFIKTVLGYDDDERYDEGGVLGNVKAYYGCVEAQGRGTLHCHMLVWLEGALNPDEIKEKILAQGDDEFKTRLLAFLDDSISNSIPEDPTPDVKHYNPSTITGPETFCNTDITKDMRERIHLRDNHILIRKCQTHTHKGTCFKYDRKSCRFDMDESNYRPVSEVDPETGSICLRCLDGLVNNFNETMIRAIRCNMDIKTIISGVAAKAVLYYITDYITKSQLKTHVAYAALELAVKKLGEYHPGEDDLAFRAKRLLQRCAYSMLSNQELSSQQVATYLMGFEDHFTSHQFTHLFWTSFEAYIDRFNHSQECY
ncbi:hypothetical protein C8J56DRAFT_763954, partial [Mycena floridula]